MHSRTLAALSGAALLAISTAASAATISVTGAGAVIPTPAAIEEDAPVNTRIEAFNEVTGHVLAGDLMTDTGMILAGTRVDSHMVFYNTQGNSTTTRQAVFTFSENILGTMSDEDGTNLFDSDFLGTLGGTDYSDTSGYGNNRGLESNDSMSFASANSLDFTMRVSEPGDWVRVVTVSQVPLPAGVALLPMGIFALGAMRRKKRKAA